MENFPRTTTDMSEKDSAIINKDIEFYQGKEAQRKIAARRPFSEKMAAVLRLRDFERALEDVRQSNRAKRAAKQITIKIKTR